MDVSASSGERAVPFKSPKRFLSDLDAFVTAKVVASAADVALVIDKGVVRDIALGNPELTAEGYDRAWRGKPWIDTVTVESRLKIEDLLKSSPADKPLWRQVNHPSQTGVDVPIKYTAVNTGDKNRIVALGRDLRSISALQQRLVEAHQGLERDYNRLREAEARYQMLFQSISYAVVIVDADSLKIEEANPAAAEIFSRQNAPLIGERLADQFLKKFERAINRSIADAWASGSAKCANVKIKGGKDCVLMMSAFRLGDAGRIIVRVLPSGKARVDQSEANRALMSVLENIPDGFAVANEDLQIVAANRAFLKMVRLSSAGQPVNRHLGEFLGRSPTDLNVLISNVKNHGFARNFSTVLRDQFGIQETVEVSAVAAPCDDEQIYGFSIRNVARRLESGSRIGEQLPSSAEQLTGLVGKISLKDIVRESTDLIEKLCIEAALEITEDNRASAAEMLGLSRQGLYSKLKRFGIGD